MLVALISSYREGSLLEGCVRSALSGCDHVAVFDGPAGPMSDDVTADGYPYIEGLVGGQLSYREGVWQSDAAKRSAMLRWVKHHYKGQDWWVLWLDGDEVLLWGEYLRDWTARASLDTAAGGFPIRLVELDGSVALCHGKIIRARVVRRYLHSSYQVELHSGAIVALPNIKVCGAGGIPWGQVPTNEDGSIVNVGTTEMELFLSRHRPPLAGEPHLLHRSMLRDPARDTRRLSDVEGDWFEEQIAAQGLQGVDE